MDFIELDPLDRPSSPLHPTVDFLPPQIDIIPDAENDDSDADIYRGEPPSPPRTPRPESVSSQSSSSSSSSSSSGSFVFGGRLGAISQLVEHAISHWSKAWASSSSLTSSSSSSASTDSIATRVRSKSSRKRSRRASVADLHNAKSEREVAARIRAREQARQAPRDFTLYTPPSDGPSKVRAGAPLPIGSEEKDGILQTDSLNLIISRLSGALKDNFKSRRALGVAQSAPGSVEQSTESTPDFPFSHISIDATPIPSPRLTPAIDPLRRKARKGKHRVGKAGPSSAPKLVSERDVDKAWWLDVSSPTPQDMRAIGKVRVYTLVYSTMTDVVSSYYKFIH